MPCVYVCVYANTHSGAVVWLQSDQLHGTVAIILRTINRALVEMQETNAAVCSDKRTCTVRLLCFMSFLAMSSISESIQIKQHMQRGKHTHTDTHYGTGAFEWIWRNIGFR